MTKKRKLPGSETIIYGVHPVRETLRAGRRAVYGLFLSRAAYDETELSALAATAEVLVSRITAYAMNALTGNTNIRELPRRSGRFRTSNWKTSPEAPPSM